MKAEKISNEKRIVDLVVISDVHLGTYGCHAKELVRYMKSIKPGKVILNGDILDIWQFSKRYFPKSHMQVIHQLIKWINKGIEITYIPGNHDELLRKFAGFRMGSLQIENKLLLELDGKKVWIFHGDVFDVTMQHSKWLTRLGSHGYDILILINAFCNWILEKTGKGKISLSKKIKNSVKSAVKFLNDFEKTCAETAITNSYDYVICGHIHQPEIKEIKTEKGTVVYLNSGDWVENLSSLEYHQGSWNLYQYNEINSVSDENEADESFVLMNNQEIFKMMLKDFKLPLTPFEKIK